MKQPELLDAFTYGNENSVSDAEKFVIKLYSKDSKATTVDNLRADLFHKVKNPERLPPTQDALHLHLKRCRFQMLIWYNATIATPNISSPEQFGWEKCGNNMLKPRLTSLERLPAICNELLTCSCRSSKCIRCTCSKHGLRCTLACGCAANCANPSNSQEDSEEETE